MILLPRWFALVVVSAVLVALGTVHSLFGTAGALMAFLSCAAVVADIIMLPDGEAFRVTRDVPTRIRTKDPHVVGLLVSNSSTRAWHAIVRDEVPGSFVSSAEEGELFLRPGEMHRLEYTIRATSRGTYSFGDVWLRISGWLGCVARIYRYPALTDVRVYTVLPVPSTSSALFFRSRTLRHGGRLLPARGQGREFESLRDYLVDDDFRRIDWKATARRGKLTTREYQVERSQNLILGFDLGRTMLADIDAVPKVEHAIRAALTLVQTAGVCDDRIGVLLFDDGIRVWLRPHRGRTHLCAVVEALNAAEGRRVEADYQLAVDLLKEQCRTRSLVVLFTDVWDPDTSAVMRQQVCRLSPQHLAVCVTLKDANLAKRVLQDVGNVRDAYEQAVARQLLLDRSRALRLLSARGIAVVDSDADRVSADLIERYLDLKRRQLL